MSEDLEPGAALADRYRRYTELCQEIARTFAEIDPAAVQRTPLGYQEYLEDVVRSGEESTRDLWALYRAIRTAIGVKEFLEMIHGHVSMEDYARIAVAFDTEHEGLRDILSL